MTKRRKKGKGCGLSRNIPDSLVPACEAGVLGTLAMSAEGLGTSARKARKRRR